MSSQMKDTIIALLKLKEIDNKLTHLKSRMDDGPRILDKRKQDTHMAEEAVRRKKEEITQVKLETKEKEVELQKKEEEIKKQELHLLTAKKMSNEEYSAHQNEIKRLKEKVGKLEEAILETMERAEEASKERAGLERELEVHTKELEEFRKEVDAEMAEYAAERESCEAERTQFVETVNFAAVHLYDRIKKARDGDAIVCADGRICGGCYMAITANDIQRLLNMRELVTCKSCQRILYLSETLR